MHGYKFEALAVGLVILAGLLTQPALGQQPLVQAQQELDHGRWRAALRLLKSYQVQHPSEPSAYDLLGLAYARAGEMDQSVRMFKKFAELSPKEPQAYNNLGAAYLRLGNAAKAETAFRRSLELEENNNIDALYNLGALLNAEHQYSAALPYLRRAYASQQSPGIVYELAVASANTGDRASALHLLNSVSPPSGAAGVPWLQMLGVLSLSARNYAAANDALEHVLRLAPNDRRSLYAMAIVQLKLNRPAEAAPLLEKSFASLPPETRHIRAGNVLAVHGAFEEAVQQFESAAKEDPGSYDAFYNLAVVRFEGTKDLPAASAAAKQALAIRSSGEAQDLLGSICDTQRLYRQALDHYQQAVRLAPADDKYSFDLGTEVMLHGDYKAALTLFQLAHKRLPKSALIDLGLGTTEFIYGNRANAATNFIDAVDLNPSYMPAYMLLGEVAPSAGSSTPKVVQKLGEIARREPDQFGIQYYYGAALVTEMDRSGNLENASLALTILRHAASLKPDDPRTYYQLGEIARLRHRNDQAVRHYEKAVSLNPDFTEALYKLARGYVRQGRIKDAQLLFAREQKLSSKQRQDLDRRSKAVERFILQIRDANVP
ncbi:MAG: tetratricopeptide repeat protein [Terriglobia bacterium]